MKTEFFFRGTPYQFVLFCNTISSQSKEKNIFTKQSKWFHYPESEFIIGQLENFHRARDEFINRYDGVITEDAKMAITEVNWNGAELLINALQLTGGFSQIVLDRVTTDSDEFVEAIWGLVQSEAKRLGFVAPQKELQKKTRPKKPEDIPKWWPRQTAKKQKWKAWYKAIRPLKDRGLTNTEISKRTGIRRQIISHVLEWGERSREAHI